MVLNDKEILKGIAQGLVSCANDTEEDNVCHNVQASSIDLRLGNTFLVPVPTLTEGGFIECNSFDKRPEYEKYEVDTFILQPKKFVLATSMECVKLPDNLTAFVEGRSSIGRMGLFVQNAGWVDAGFTGEITLELFNATDIPIKLNSGTRVAQLVFCKMVSPAISPYDGKYQNQRGATESRIDLDKERSSNNETD